MNDLSGLFQPPLPFSLERLSGIKRHLDNPSSQDAKRPRLYEEEPTAISSLITQPEETEDVPLPHAETPGNHSNEASSTTQFTLDDENLSLIKEILGRAVDQNMLSILGSLTPPEQDIQHESQAVCEQKKVPEAAKVLELVNKANEIFMLYKSNMCKMLRNMTAYVICAGFDPIPLPKEVQFICQKTLKVRMYRDISNYVISLDINKEQINGYFDILNGQKLSSGFNEVFGPDYCNHIKNRLLCSIGNHSRGEAGAPLLTPMNGYVHDNSLSFQTPDAPNKTDRNFQLEGGITPSSSSQQPSGEPKEAEVLEFISKAIEASKNSYKHTIEQYRFRRIIVYALCGGFHQSYLPDYVQSKFELTNVPDIMSNYTNRILTLTDQKRISPIFKKLREQKLGGLYDNIFGEGRFVQVHNYLLSFEKTKRNFDMNISLTPSSFNQPSEEPKEAEVLEFISKGIDASMSYKNSSDQRKTRRIIVFALCGGFHPSSLPDYVESKFKQKMVRDIMSNYAKRILFPSDRIVIEAKLERLREQKLDKLYNNIFGVNRFIQVRDYLLSFKTEKAQKNIDRNRSLTPSSSSHQQSEEPKEADFLAIVSELSEEEL